MRQTRPLLRTVVLILIVSGLGMEAAAQAGAPAPKETASSSQPTATPNPPKPEQKPPVPSIDVKPADKLDFEQQLVGSQSVVQTITITAGPVQIDEVDLRCTGEFTVGGSPCDAKPEVARACTLKPNDSCALTIRFAPLNPKKTAASITITTKPDTGSKTIALLGEGVDPVLRWTGCWRSVWPPLLICLMFLVGIMLVRWNMVARPSRRLLQAHIDAVRAQTKSLPEDQGKGTREQVLDLLERVEAVFIKAKKKTEDSDKPGGPRRQRVYIADYFFWTRGEESAAWLGIHEAEEMLCKVLAIDEVRARMQTVRPELREMNSPPANALADAIADVLKPPPGQPVPSEGFERALLSEALGIVYDSRDRSYNAFMSWQNKAVWLVGCGLLFIGVLAVALQQGTLLLAGAVGGLLSRLSRSLQRANVPTDYGASWTTLFLSPVVGAMAGWSGVLLVLLGVQLQVLGPVFNVKSDLSGTLMLGIAFLLGFSERAFNGILTQLEDKVQAQAQVKAAQAQELNITTGKTLSPATVGAPYPQRLAATGGTPPYKWTLTAGKLPDGLSLDSAGTFTGTPTVAGTFTLTLQVSDAGGSKPKAQEFTIVVGQ
jgi:hypothetical protein